MKLAEIVAKSDKELAELIVSTRKQLTDDLIASRTKEVSNVKVISATKKQLARALTIERQRAPQGDTNV